MWYSGLLVQFQVRGMPGLWAQSLRSQEAADPCSALTSIFLFLSPFPLPSSLKNINRKIFLNFRERGAMLSHIGS